MQNQTLDQYIGKLMSDDDELKKFLADPSNGGLEHGISKAERAVLRRTVASLSNNSKNGYSVQRDYGSYRRSLRLLQNVLHQHASHHAVGQVSLLNAEPQGAVGYAPNEAATQNDIEQSLSFHVYFTGQPETSPGAPYNNPALAYTEHVKFTGVSKDGTLGSAMQFPNPAPTGTSFTSQPVIVQAQDNDYKLLTYNAVKRESHWFIESFTLNNLDGTSAKVYNLPYQDPTEHDPFWYYSLNGQAITKQDLAFHINPASIQGTKGFNMRDITEVTSVYWQAIAPDTVYGFSPCFPNNDISYLVLGPQIQPELNKSNGVFFQNKISNVFINPEVKTWILASNEEGTGNLVTDDAVEISATLPSGEIISIYQHDYSNGRSGQIRGTGPQPLDILLSDQFKGQHVTIEIRYINKCSRFISSNPYILIPYL